MGLARLVVLATLTLAFLTAPLTVEGQPAGKAYRIGFLRVGPPPAAWIEGLRQGLRELGYLEGRNMVIEFGLASSTAQVPDVAAGLVRLKVDVIVASGTPSLLPARDAAGKIPVVFVAAIDPVATRLVASLARRCTTEYLPVPDRAGWWHLVPIWNPDQTVNPLRRYEPATPR